jgi:DNA polymerase Ligase (LigD)
MPRYVILEHDHPELHWDLMLEAGEVLRTWQLHGPPHPGRAVAATASFDHRLLYLDYEGAVSGGRGRVTRWDAGTFALEEERAGWLVLRLAGARLAGPAVLEETAAGRWSFTAAEPPA